MSIGAWIAAEFDIWRTAAGLKGADARSLLKEASSYDTIGNGYFALTIHAVPAGWRCAHHLHT